MDGEVIKKWLIRIAIVVGIVMALQCALFPNSAFIKGWIIEKDGENTSYNLFQYNTAKSLAEDSDAFYLDYLFKCDSICCAINQKFVDVGIAQDKCLDAETGGSDETETPVEETNQSDESDDIEIVCAGIWNPTVSTCAAGACNEGTECVYHPATLFAPASCSCDTPVTCTDSDGGYFVGTWGHCESSAVPIGYPDTCGDGGVITEYYCAEDMTCDSTQYVCPFGCEDGACINLD